MQTYRYKLVIEFTTGSKKEIVTTVSTNKNLAACSADLAAKLSKFWGNKRFRIYDERGVWHLVNVNEVRHMYFGAIRGEANDGTDTSAETERGDQVPDGGEGGEDLPALGQ